MIEGGYSDQKEDNYKANIHFKGNEGVYFGESCNWRGYMVALLRGEFCFLSLRYTLWKFDDGYKIECRLGMRFFTWYILI